ncbi:hypothetical protein [Streptomyces virginiae]|uniref:hypothetical protein n=1 Tax=Streptomyces virginiae TaxID=1961 RepID=UPI0036F7EAD2
MSKKPKPAGEPPPQDDQADQMALFTTTAGADKTARTRPNAPPSLNKVLNNLVTAIARMTGISYPEVNRRLNRKLGVTSRAGASDELLERGIALAEQYIDHESRRAVQAATPAVPLQAPRADAAKAPVQPPHTPPRRNVGPPPTDEQQRAIETKQAGAHFALQAGAGTGKTTTLAMLARSDRGRGMFLAFNRPVVDDAARKFPPHVRCLTGHSLAMREVGALYRARLGKPRDAWASPPPCWCASANAGSPTRHSPT